MAINAGNNYLIANDIKMPMTLELLARHVVAARTPQKFSEGDQVHPQTGTPFGIQVRRFVSPLGIPGKALPYGSLTAIDLKTRRSPGSIPWDR